MWLATTSIAATGATLAGLALPKRYNFGFLALMLWGAAIMILVDHVIGYSGGAFVEKTTEGMIKNSAMLGIVMMAPVIMIWGISIVVSNLTSRPSGKGERIH